MTKAEQEMLLELAEFAMLAAADQLGGKARDALHDIEAHLQALAREGTWHHGKAPLYDFGGEDAVTRLENRLAYIERIARGEVEPPNPLDPGLPIL